MNTAEAGALVKFVRSAFPDQETDDGTPDAWAMIMPDVKLSDAMKAVIGMSRRKQPYDRRLRVTPNEIIDEVKTIRSHRIEAAEQHFMPSSGDPSTYMAELRTWRLRAADGEFDSGEFPAPQLESKPTGNVIRMIRRSSTIESESA